MRLQTAILWRAIGFSLMIAALIGQDARQTSEARTVLHPPLFFREDWKQPPPSDEDGIPATQGAVSNPKLELKLYGPSGKNILLAGNRPNSSMPLNLWTGNTTSPSAATLRHIDSYVDLTGSAKLRWVTRTSGFHVVRPVVKLADQSWLVGDVSSGTWADFNESEISFSEVRWMVLDIERIVTKGRWVEKPDLSKVDEGDSPISCRAVGTGRVAS